MNRPLGFYSVSNRTARVRQEADRSIEGRTSLTVDQVTCLVKFFLDHYILHIQRELLKADTSHHYGLPQCRSSSRHGYE